MNKYKDVPDWYVGVFFLRWLTRAVEQVVLDCLSCHTGPWHFHDQVSLFSVRYEFVPHVGMFLDIGVRAIAVRLCFVFMLISSRHSTSCLGLRHCCVGLGDRHDHSRGYSRRDD